MEPADYGAVYMESESAVFSDMKWVANPSTTNLKPKHPGGRPLGGGGKAGRAFKQSKASREEILLKKVSAKCKTAIDDLSLSTTADTIVYDIASDDIIDDGSWMDTISWKCVGKATYTGMSSRNQRRKKLERKITQETANRMHLIKIDTFFLPVDDGARNNSRIIPDINPPEVEDYNDLKLTYRGAL